MQQHCEISQRTNVNIKTMENIFIYKFFDHLYDFRKLSQCTDSFYIISVIVNENYFLSWQGIFSALLKKKYSLWICTFCLGKGYEQSV